MSAGLACSAGTQTPPLPEAPPRTDNPPRAALLPRLAAATATLRDRLFDPVDPASLWVLRVVFGLLLFFATVRFWQNGWIQAHYIAPKFFFKYYGFEWVRPLSAAWMTACFAAMAVTSLFIAAGLFYRASAAVFFVLFSYAHFIDKTHYLNHYYFVSLFSFLLIFTPLNRVGSLDQRLGLVAHTARIPRWALWLLRFQIGAVYFFAGLAKLTPDWLFHAQPLTIWLGANTDFPLVGPLFRYKATAFAMSWAGAGFDLSVPFLLSHRRTRPFAYAAVVVFHGLTGKLFPIGMFPWIMTSAALVFFSADWPRRLLPAPFAERLFGPPPDASPQRADAARADASPERDAARPDSPARPSRSVQTAILAALALYAALQIFVPLRAHLYSGPVCWTEQGFRFSWRVMLVEKNGDVQLTATDPTTGKRWKIDPREHLYPYQIKQMSTQPDMILEYAHFIADDFRRRGYPDIEVRARAYVAMNGRPPVLLIDPDVDLARQTDGLTPYAFLLPAPSMAPEL
ncbi:MAG: HTTM domain-containing protein [Polyangiaceae bacterium]